MMEAIVLKTQIGMQILNEMAKVVTMINSDGDLYVIGAYLKDMGNTLIAAQKVIDEMELSK